jgi:N-acetylmuramic acid 6-phosphate etherase
VPAEPEPDAVTRPLLPRTEMRNDRTTDIDTVGTLELLRLLNAEDAVVAGAVAVILPTLAEVVDLTVARVRGGGHVHYFGAGSSGRIGVLDAAEVVPTFGVDASLFVAHHAGGESAVAHAVEGAEDRESLGRQAAAAVSGGDVAVGLSASGRTPYVAGALRGARAAGALTVLVSSNLSAPLADLADRALLVDTGPEAIAGSTRLKASTAQKMILNSLSTAVMIRLGRTHSNLMVSMSGTNEKLRQRQIFILTEASGATEAACRAELARCGGDLRLAMVCLLSGLEPEAAALALAAGGSVRAALAGAPAEAGTGCRYPPRCPISIGRCRTEDPPLAVIAGEHEAACFRAGEVPAEVPGPTAADAEPTAGIRAAAAADADAMAEVFVAAWRQAYPGVVPDAVLAALDHDRTARWLAGLIDGHPEGNAAGQTDVAVRDGQVIGFVRYGTRTGEPGGYVFGLYVHPAQAGHGTGRSLLSHAEQRLREQGSDTVSLHVFEANERARRLYAKAGYTPDGSTRVEPEHEATEVRLVKAFS